ncbi:TetR/AcrR family transcriptional regulator [Nocardioides sp. LML1-1-1.1]|uniref:TetR/AcrR family transcriptional regulator n=1 Tax=Nocardioides sp. LML1-1-1.1 TaxID=3135248 RepID=UPI003433548D
MTGPRERLLATAVTLIRERGVAGTGLAELLKESGTARGSIYQHFPRGKDDLVAAAVAEAGTDGRATLATLRALGDPAVVVTAIMHAARDTLDADGYVHGCPIAAGALAGPDYPAVVGTAGDALAGWVEELAGVLAATGMAAEAASPFASLVISVFEGALVQARASRSPAPFDAAADQLALLARAQLA